VVREVLEETGLVVDPTAVAGVVERPGLEGAVYVIEDFVAALAGGADPESAVAGDDADDVGWFTAEQLRSLPLVEGLLETLTGWGVLGH
jgi:ADP-ribose pyrophosphatase YjhB (NUDIX family)